jgi:hypothetical protein
MTSRITTITEQPDFNILRIGFCYIADTAAGSHEGVYLGVETPYGDRSMLLRQGNGRTSTIPFRRVVSIRPAASLEPRTRPPR